MKRVSNFLVAMAAVMILGCDKNNDGNEPGTESAITEIKATVENGASYNDKIDEVRAIIETGYDEVSGAYTNGGFTIKLPETVPAEHLFSPTEYWKNHSEMQNIGATVTPATTKLTEIDYFQAYKASVKVGKFEYKKGTGDYYNKGSVTEAVYVYTDRDAVINGKNITKSTVIWNNVFLKKGWNIVYQITSYATNSYGDYTYTNIEQGGLKWYFEEYEDSGNDKGENNNGNAITDNPGIGAATSTTDPGVVINGVRWATRNIATPGYFASSPNDVGLFYQWNRKKAWAATGNVSGWDDTNAEGDSWATANDPSPEGWRVPTRAELNKLLESDKVSSVWTTQNGVNGRLFTDITSGNTLFLPAAGYRDTSDGTLYNAGTFGFYWSSTASGTAFAYSLFFSSDYADWYDGLRRYGFSVRSVAE
ncbi:hypothetical protein FACS189430_12000 [Bacteroidia bacterium]|nr:hypothetical protein FACS189430_12000 [Bacteroidia bacterium]